MAEQGNTPAKVSPQTASALAAIDAWRADVDKADTPEAVQDVRAKLRVLREVCAAAMRDPACKAEDVAHARRECEQLALEAAVKLGTMVPDAKEGGDPTPGVGSLAKRTGVSASTLRNYRDLAAAYATKASEFMSIARDAINSGAAVPFKQLIALVKPEKPKEDRPASSRPRPPRDDPPTPSPASAAATLANAAERARQESARQSFANTRAEYETDDPIKFIGASLDKIARFLSDAQQVYKAMAPHPLPGTERQSHPRDVRLQIITEFFDDAVPTVLAAIPVAKEEDAKGVKALRAARDRRSA